MKTKTRSGSPVRRGARLGQHFLTNPVVARSVAESAGVRPGITVLEIGPGTGALTRVLLEMGGVVTAIEKDSALVAKLRETFAAEIAAGRLRIIEGDVRDADPRAIFGDSPYVLAANIPYYITGEIIRHFLTAAHPPSQMSLLMQKEVADRIVARDRKESILSLSVKAFGTPRLIRKVPPGNFSPPPSVDSAVLQIADISRALFDDLDEARFFMFVKTGFSSRRKKLAGNLRALVPAAALEESGVSADARAEDLTLDQWARLARYKAA